MQVAINRKDIKFLPDTSRVIARFLYSDDKRAISTIHSVLNMTEDEASVALSQVLRDFAIRHRNISKIFESHFEKIAHLFSGLKIQLLFLSYPI